MDFKNQNYSNYIKRIKKEKIPCYEPMVGFEEINNLKKVIKSGWLSEKTFTRNFENFVAKYCKRKYSLAFTNATSAMIVGIQFQPQELNLFLLKFRLRVCVLL